MIYAIMYQEADDDGPNCTLGNAAYDVLIRELGKEEFSGGSDNGWGCYAVDSESKVPTLQKALPGLSVIEMTPTNFKLWSMSFGEFNPDDGIEGWYKSAKCQYVPEELKP